MSGLLPFTVCEYRNCVIELHGESSCLYSSFSPSLSPFLSAAAGGGGVGGGKRNSRWIWGLGQEEEEEEEEEEEAD